METDDMTAPRYGYVEQLRESTARERVQSGESSGLNMANRLDLAMREVGMGERNKDSAGKEAQKSPQRKQQVTRE